MTGFEKTGLIFFAVLVLSSIWKWRESKWIKIFNVARNCRNDISIDDWKDIHDHRDALHKGSALFIGLLFPFLSFMLFGLTWTFAIMSILIWIEFWILDILLNIFLKQKPLYVGSTAALDRVSFWIRFVIFIIFTIILIFVK
jgi:hypothetical protein